MTTEEKPKRKGLPIEKRLHVVLCEGGGLPTVVHKTWAAAYRAACLLAEANPGQRFHVMQTQSIRVVKGAAGPDGAA